MSNSRTNGSVASISTQTLVYSNQVQLYVCSSQDKGRPTILAAKLKPGLDHRGKGRPCRRIQTGIVEILFLSNWKRGCHCCRIMVLPPNIHGPFSIMACIFSSVLNLKIIKPLAVAVTFSSSHYLHTREAILLTTWYGILYPGKKPTMQRFHCSEFSCNISSDTLRRCPTGCLGILSRVKRVLESDILILSAQEDWLVVGEGLALVVVGNMVGR